jgi:hypothetical protein
MSSAGASHRPEGEGFRNGGLLMVEALADLALAMTVAMAYADNIRQQTTINIEARGKVVSGGGNDRGVVVSVVTTATMA